MKIVNYILALSFVCCAATTPIKAKTISYEFINEIMKGNDPKASPMMYQMAISFAEKKIK